MIHVHDWLAARAGIALAEAAHVPLVATIHATEAGRWRGWVSGPVSQAIHSIEWWLCNRADRVIVCAASMRDEISVLFGRALEAIDVITNGVDARAWQVSSTSRHEAEQHWRATGHGRCLRGSASTRALDEPHCTGGCASSCRGVVITYEWRGHFDNPERNALHAEGFEHRVLDDGWWTQVKQHSLGWVCARSGDDLIGFVNVVWDGAVHAFILDTLVTAGSRRQGVGVELVGVAIRQARAAGCEWLHVDFDVHLRPFYFDSCGFRPTDAGLIAL